VSDVGTLVQPRSRLLPVSRIISGPSDVDPIGSRSSTLVVVSNRLPYDLGRPNASTRRNVGGLVNALEPVFDRLGGVWVGWDGVSLPSARAVSEMLAHPRSMTLPSGRELFGVPLSERELSRYYNGLCNRALWPLLHDFPDKGTFVTEDWETYVQINRRFAAITMERVRGGGRVWVHDYQLTLVPRFLRELGFTGPIDFFLHTPFPPTEIFRALPWRSEVLAGLLAADTVVFHTARYLDNFVDAACSLGPAMALGRGGTGPVDLTHRGGCTRVAAEPIGIDVEGFTTIAASPEADSRARRIRAAYGERAIVFGAERLDYTKGILERLSAVERLLRLHPETTGTFVLVQVVVPSRHVVEEYRRMKRDIDREVGRINGECGVDGWQPVHYRYRALDRAELVAHFLAASVALVTPLRDGMNLVAAEFAASRIDGAGVLVLSEFAGIADVIEGALLVNPNDIESLARTLHRALSMPPGEQKDRMSRMRPAVLANPARAWAERCLAVGSSSHPAPTSDAFASARPIPWNAT
jgi:alpha,alpha-trehalose-phosphate synthase [UDP-forming]